MSFSRIWVTIFISFYLFLNIFASSDNAGCPNRVFLGCVLRLKAQRVPFEKNILNVIFNIGSEARLMHTCKAYSEIMPCFRDKILECGNDKQRRMLNEVGKTLMFLCSPFSMERQKLLIRHQKCIGEILALPATVGCKLHDSYHGKQLLKCRETCAQKPTDFTCMLKTWISEQNVCTLRDIHDKCGTEASFFYTDMQSTVFEPMFPVLCDFPPEVTAPPPTISPQPFFTTPLYPEIEAVATVVPTTMIPPPRTIISIPPPPNNNGNGNLIQPQPSSRIRTFGGGNGHVKKHKPAIVDNRPFPFRTSPSSTFLTSPQPSSVVAWKTDNQGYSVTALPFTPSPSSNQYPLVSLFRKILPGNLPEKFSFFFEKKKEAEIMDIQKTEKPSIMPIAAKEVYEINALPASTTVSSTSDEEIIFLNTQVSKDFPITTTEALFSSTTPVSSIREASFTQPQTTTFLLPPPPTTTTNSPYPIIYTFTSKPKNYSKETNNIPLPTPPPINEKWRPWYLGGGGFSHVQSDAEKFRIPLYHGA